MLVKVNVTQALIEGALRRTAHFCPVASAFNKLEGAKNACVGATVTISINGETWRGVLPPKVVDRIRFYDAHGKMIPFEFQIELQQRAVKTGV